MGVLGYFRIGKNSDLSLLKSNTVKKRVHSLFRQGCMLYELIPNMPAERLRPLMVRFNEMLNEQRVFKNLFGVL